MKAEGISGCEHRPCGSGAVPAEDELTARLLRIWRQIFRNQSIGPDDAFFELGGNFSLAVRLCAAVERLTKHSLAPSLLMQASTPARLASILRREKPPAPPPAVLMNGIATGRPIFLLPGLSGDALSLWPLARRLTCRRPIYALQADWIDEEDQTLSSVEELAAAHIARIRAVQPAGPYALCGFSFGGLLAFEIARRLQSQGEAIELLALIDPLLHERNLPFGRWATFQARRLARRAAIIRQRPASKNVAYVANKTEQVFDGLRHRIRARVLQPNSAPSSGLSSRLRRTQDRAGVAFAHYRPSPYPGAVILFMATIRHRRFCDPLPVWFRVAKRGAEMIPVSGSHLKIVEEPSVALIASALLDRLPKDARLGA